MAACGCGCAGSTAGTATAVSVSGLVGCVCPVLRCYTATKTYFHRRANPPSSLTIITPAEPSIHPTSKSPTLTPIPHTHTTLTMSNTQPEDEEALVKARVLAHEARPYNRLVKRCSSLTTPDTPLTPDAAARLRDDIDTDFKYFESVITRIQLLKDTNRREVERYEKEKGDILETASTARSTLISLRTTLQKTQNEKANKLLYDAIATDILRTGGLKARDEQTVNLDRLHKEISALEREREDYRAVWAARRTQFGQIVDQLEKMWAQIKEDKDEQDRREGMSEEEEGEEVEGAGRRSSPQHRTASPSIPSLQLTPPAPGAPLAT
ncbi:hypothetical protein P167DRAFT_595500 [Morchella conica CCBAS932]|uniref:Uncharacterized protein n=1 Tax=Morchella conica CCBAS932 TaxID=1392247 RepID=A0A3N4KH69_9PEZI|nr:hypothetical protein P167DRAFT_595500 [Morchella conica CCBAS932]